MTTIKTCLFKYRVDNTIRKKLAEGRAGEKGHRLPQKYPSNFEREVGGYSNLVVHLFIHVGQNVGKGGGWQGIRQI